MWTCLSGRDHSSFKRFETIFEIFVVGFQDKLYFLVHAKVFQGTGDRSRPLKTINTDTGAR